MIIIKTMRKQCIKGCTIIRSNRCLKASLVFTCIWIIVLCFNNPLKNFSPYELLNSIAVSAFQNILPSYVIELNDQRFCKPQSNVTFFKTHKTASCSIQNIFLRYAKFGNYTMLIPPVGNYFGHPSLFRASMVPPLKPGSVYNIFCHHHRWNYKEVQSVMPPNTNYITILRDPIKVFESLYFYSRLDNFYNMSLKNFSRMKKTTKNELQLNKRYRGLGRNQMSFDLGMNVIDFDNKRAISNFIGRLDSQFHLVLIAEKMHESLILLRHLLCWSIEDVVVFRHNARLPNAVTQLDYNVREGLMKWNRADQILYDYFYGKLMKTIDNFGESNMKAEVQKLMDRTAEWFSYCVENVQPANKISAKYRPYHPSTYGFSLKNGTKNVTCEALVKGELPFTDEMRIRQKKYYQIKQIRAQPKRRWKPNRKLGLHKYVNKRKNARWFSAWS